MRILVTGGAGFVGSHVAEVFLAEGHDVLVLDNLSSGRRENVPKGARLLEVDLLDESLQEILEQERIEVVDHHAAQVHVKASLEDPVFDVRQNVLATVHLLDACRRAGVRKVLFASSGGALYGEMRERPFQEADPPRPFSVYGVDKLACEGYLEAFAANFGLEYAALRYANVYGPRQNASGEGGVVAVFAAGMLRGRDFRVHGDGGQVRDFVYVEDAARANVAALAHRENGAFNVGTGKGTTVNELFEMLAGITGFSGAPRRSMGRLGDLRASVLDCSRAERVLGWKAEVSLPEGLRRTVEFYKGFP